MADLTRLKRKLVDRQAKAELEALEERTNLRSWETRTAPDLAASAARIAALEGMVAAYRTALELIKDEEDP